MDAKTIQFCWHHTAPRIQRTYSRSRRPTLFVQVYSGPYLLAGAGCETSTSVAGPDHRRLREGLIAGSTSAKVLPMQRTTDMRVIAYSKHTDQPQPQGRSRDTPYSADCGLGSLPLNAFQRKTLEDNATPKEPLPARQILCLAENANTPDAKHQRNFLPCMGHLQQPTFDKVSNSPEYRWDNANLCTRCIPHT
jgi:hypothetical protein